MRYLSTLMIPPVVSVVPLSRPIIVTLTLITIVSHWNSVRWPFVVTTGTEWRVVTVAIASLHSQFNGN